MTSATQYPYSPAPRSQTTGHGAPRSSRLPNNAMPPAWQSRNAPYYAGQRIDTPARSIVDIALDPLRWMTATKPRKVIGAAAFGLLVITILL